jgi:hypothetical protein
MKELPLNPLTGMKRGLLPIPSVSFRQRLIILKKKSLEKINSLYEIRLRHGPKLPLNMRNGNAFVGKIGNGAVLTSAAPVASATSAAQATLG